MKSAIMKQNLIFWILCCTLLASCGKKTKSSYDEIGSSGLTTRTENLIANMHAIAEKGVLIGQMYGTLEGVGWKNDTTKYGDIQSISNDRPACNGYELCGIEYGDTLNTDGLPFHSIKKDILTIFKRGGVAMIKWSCPNYQGKGNTLRQWTSQIAKYLDSLQNEYGIKVPIILFLYPRDGSSWYTKLSSKDYLKLYNKTHKELQEQGVTNVIYGYSFSGVTSESVLKNELPTGIDVIHLALSYPEDYKNKNDYDTVLNTQLQMMTKVAKAQHLISGLSCGMQGIPDPTFFSQTLLPLIKQSKLTFLLFGPNQGTSEQKRYDVPYPGESNNVISDFMQFYNDPSTLFLKDLNGLYVKSERQKYSE